MQKKSWIVYQSIITWKKLSNVWRTCLAKKLTYHLPNRNYDLKGFWRLVPMWLVFDCLLRKVFCIKIYVREFTRKESFSDHFHYFVYILYKLYLTIIIIKSFLSGKKVFQNFFERVILCHSSRRSVSDKKEQLVDTE